MPRRGPVSARELLRRAQELGHQLSVVPDAVDEASIVMAYRVRCRCGWKTDGGVSMRTASSMMARHLNDVYGQGSSTAED